MHARDARDADADAAKLAFWPSEAPRSRAMLRITGAMSTRALMVAMVHLLMFAALCSVVLIETEHQARGNTFLSAYDGVPDEAQRRPIIQVRGSHTHMMHASM